MSVPTTDPRGRGAYSLNLTEELIEAGRRMADALNEQITSRDFDEIKMSFMAFKIADGSTDGVLYPSKTKAAQYQKGGEYTCYYAALRNMLGGANYRDCAIMIKFARDAYQSGFRLIDPEHRWGGPDIAVNTATHDVALKRIRLSEINLALQRGRNSL